MQNLKTFAILFIIFAGNSCVTRPHRPDAPMCGASGDCINGSGEFQVDPRILICSDPRGYALYEDYIDGLELEIKRLRRTCRRN